MKSYLKFFVFLLLYLIARFGVNFLPGDLIEMEVVFIIISILSVIYLSFAIVMKELKEVIFLSLWLSMVALSLFIIYPLIPGLDVVEGTIFFGFIFAPLMFFYHLILYLIKEKRKEKSLAVFMISQAAITMLLVVLVEKLYFLS